MYKITKVIGREILDSRGYPTVEAEVHLNNGCFGKSSVPSGASTGTYEAIELRDNDNRRFLGKGVLNAVKIINTKISPEIIGEYSQDQIKIDQIMIDIDGTQNKSNFGSNSILAVSLANAKATALAECLDLYQYIAILNGTPNQFSMPLPMVNIINGGKHADNNIDIQEFMIQPICANNITKAIQICSEIFHSLYKILKANNLSTTVGDEGGYAPNLPSNISALNLIKEAIETAGYQFGKDISLCLDCAASEFFNKKDNLYELKSENKTFSSQEFTHYLEHLTQEYSISSIEDGLDENDWNGFLYQTKRLGNYIQLVGDDLFVTNPYLLKKGIEQNIANAILIKLNQIGTLTETLDTINIAKNAGYATIISHRSGETEDVFIADLAVGTSAGQIKTGSMSRSERVAKYNQLIRIEEKLGKKY